MANVLFSIMQDSFHIKRVLLSCTTQEQLDNCTEWVNNVFNVWEKKLEANKCSKKSVDFIIFTIIPDISNVVNTVGDDIRNANRRYKPYEVVVSGFQ